LCSLLPMFYLVLYIRFIPFFGGFKSFFSMFLIFCFIITFCKKLSESILGPLIDLMPWGTSFLLALTNIWSNWICVVWFGDIQVAFFVYVGIVLLIVILCAKPYSLNISPSPLVSLFQVCLPVTLLYTSSLPNFAIRSPSAITISPIWTLSTTDCKSL